jgi:hypothetical protein
MSVKKAADLTIGGWRMCVAGVTAREINPPRF